MVAVQQKESSALEISCTLTMTSFALLEISNGDILCFVKIPNFDDDIACFADSFPDQGRSHTPRRGFSIEIFICAPPSSVVFVLALYGVCQMVVEHLYCIGQKSLFAGNFISHCLDSWGLSMGTVASHWQWSDYSIQIAPFCTTFCTILYHFLHHFVQLVTCCTTSHTFPYILHNFALNVK